MNPLEVTLLALALLALIVGVITALAGAVSAGPRDFLDRPLCWLFGHDLNRYLYPTEHHGVPAEVWRCARGHAPVTLVGNARRYAP